MEGRGGIRGGGLWPDLCACAGPHHGLLLLLPPPKPTPPSRLQQLQNPGLTFLGRGRALEKARAFGEGAALLGAPWPPRGSSRSEVRRRPRLSLPSGWPLTLPSLSLSPPSPAEPPLLHPKGGGDAKSAERPISRSRKLRRSSRRRVPAAGPGKARSWLARGQRIPPSSHPAEKRSRGNSHPASLAAGEREIGVEDFFWWGETVPRHAEPL